MRHCHHTTVTRAITRVTRAITRPARPLVSVAGPAGGPMLVCALVLGLLAAAAGQARAERFELGIGASIHQAASSSVHAVHDGTRVDFSLLGAMPLTRTAGLDILVDASLDTGTATGTTFRRMDAETSAVIALVGARARLPLTGRLSVHGRAALGMGRVAVDMQDPASSWSMRDSGYSGSAYLGAGLDFLPVRPGKSAPTMGLRLELGYLRMTPVALTTGATGDDDALAIPTTGTDLGDLDLSAFTTRLSFVSRF